jgi:hypothetical protein
LRGISRVALQAGKSRKIHFDLNPRDLSSVTVAGDRVVAPGAYRITIGEGQPGTGAMMRRGSLQSRGLRRCRNKRARAGALQLAGRGM